MITTERRTELMAAVRWQIYQILDLAATLSTDLKRMDDYGFRLSLDVLTEDSAAMLEMSQEIVALVRRWREEESPHPGVDQLQELLES